jgi:hypothetical protein
MIDAIVCPACESLVEPSRRKLPSTQITTERGSTKYSAPTLAFGYFCPSDGCGARLDRAMEKAQGETVEVAHSEQPAIVEESIAEPAKVVSIQDKRPAPVRVAKPATTVEDVESRIRREHEEACREEQDLKARIEHVAKRRRKLDLLIAALDAAQEPIAAE